jgi:multidrug efflux pump subunit AcrB/ABC-type multidrug transport system ATPase subunit
MLKHAQFKFDLFALPIRRPVATSMFFLAVSLMGLFAWYRIPIEFLPALSGDSLSVQIVRPGSEPDVIEREILIPLEQRIEELAGVDETDAEINGSSAQITITFERGSNYRVRELELTRIAADLQRTQPQGTFIRVASNDSSFISRLILQVQVIGGDDPVSLRDFADQQLLARFTSVPGVSQALFQGAPPREVTVWIDPVRCAEVGIRPGQVQAALARSVQHIRFLGGVEEGNHRYSVLLDGRPDGVVSLGEIRIDPNSPVLLRHVADIEMGAATQDSLFRINGQPALGLILLQDEGSNVVQLGRDLKARIEELRTEFNPYGIDFVIGFDASQTIEDQIGRLRTLALGGFIISLVVLFLFLKELRAVAVVAIAVPVSLLASGAMLYLGGYTLNLITLSGLAIGVGMLVDNSIVVYEAVQRCLERGLSPENAAIDGINKTVRAIMASSITTAVVYLPVSWLVDDVQTRAIVLLVAAAILLPLVASLVVAAGLVPLLAQKISAGATLARMERSQRQSELLGSKPRNTARQLFAGLLKSALRRPTPWIAFVSVSILLTILIALPWVLVNTGGQQAESADQVQLEVNMEGNNSLDSAGDIFARLEQAALDIPGVEQVSSSIQEETGSITIDLVDAEERPAQTTAGYVRRTLIGEAEKLEGVELGTASAAGGAQGGGGDDGGLLGDAPAEIVLSGPDMAQLNALATEIQDNLLNIGSIETATISGRQGREELQIRPDFSALNSYRLFPENVLQSLTTLRREGTQMQVGFVLADGRELPMTIRQREVATSSANQMIQDVMISYQQSALPLGQVTTVTNELPPPNIVHHNGRRELKVSYQISDQAPRSGPFRQQLDDQIDQVIDAVVLPDGYTVDSGAASEASSLVNTLALPILLMLYAVLAISFESLTLPLLILIAVPLTILGATWALVFAGWGISVMVGVGAIALLGITVNPAIILVDRMQHRLLNSNCSPGTAALGAVRERTRPVLMTSATTIAGLLPLTLSTGTQGEIWPPFATVMVGGLTTSTLLTLLVIPVGYVFLARIDRLFAKLGPWVTLLWFCACVAVLAPFFVTEQITSFYWQIVTSLIVGSLFLWIAKKRFLKEKPVYINPSPITVETRYLGKVYGQPGPVAKAFAAGKTNARNAHLQSRRDLVEKALVHFLLFCAALYLAMNIASVWRLAFAYVAGAFASRALINLARTLRMPGSGARSRVDILEDSIRAAWPWLLWVLLAALYTVIPLMNQQASRMPIAALVVLFVLTVFFQLSRNIAIRIARKEIQILVPSGFMSAFRTEWRRFCMTFFSLGLQKETITASHNNSFKVEEGMIGILGPNGAGKTTLLRTLAGVLNPSIGTTHFAGHERRKILPAQFSEIIGYLPQEFGLPDHLTAEEYLHYYAILYRVGNQQERHERVAMLLKEVGLAERKHDKIGGYSGGMRQRVAVARTLLRLPPVIIVDEPTVGLDPRERIRFRNLLAKLAKGRVILFSTHVVEDVAVSCDRVLVFSAGTICYDGAPPDLALKAENQVWLLTTEPNETPQLQAGAKVIDQIPTAEGGALLRILCATQPDPRAEATEASMEDGYMQLQKGNFAKVKQAGEAQ